MRTKVVAPTTTAHMRVPDKTRKPFKGFEGNFYDIFYISSGRGFNDSAIGDRTASVKRVILSFKFFNSLSLHVFSLCLFVSTFFISSSLP